MTVVVFDLEHIFFFILYDVGISICCREVIAMTLFLAPMVPKESLVVLVFFASLALMGGRL